jgi:hypothetical protein
MSLAGAAATRHVGAARLRAAGARQEVLRRCQQQAVG